MIISIHTHCSFDKEYSTSSHGNALMVIIFSVRIWVIKVCILFIFYIPRQTNKCGYDANINVQL